MKALVERIIGRPVAEEWFDPVAARLDGWAAGAVIVARAWRRDPGSPSLTARGYEAIHDYLDDQVLAPMDPEVLALLSDSVRLPRLSAALWDEVVGRGDGQDLLERFRDNGGLRASPGTDHSGFRVHDMLRSVVEQRTAESSPGIRASLSPAAVDWYLSNGEPLAAIELLADERRWAEMEDIVRSSLFDVLAANQTTELVEVLSRVPANLMAKQGSWINGVAALEQMAGNSRRALEMLVIGEQWLSPGSRMIADLIRATAATFDHDPAAALIAGEAVLDACGPPPGRNAPTRS